MTEADLLRIRNYNLTLLMVLGVVFLLCKKSVLKEMMAKSGR